MLIENFRIAFTGLFSNKLRTMLSVLGILIGVMSVTLLLAVGTGAAKTIDKQVSDLGAGVVYVFPRGFQGVAQTKEPAITKADMAALKSSPLAPSILRVAPELQLGDGNATNGSKSTKPAKTIGTDSEWFKVFARPAVTGLILSEQDVTARRRVVVIGKTIARKLFPGESAVGRSIRINGVDFQIIGLLQPRGGGLDGDQDAIILMPYTAMTDTLTGTFKTFSDLAVQGRPGTAAGVTKKELDRVLASTHKITDPKKYDWDTFDNAQLASITANISVAFRGLLGLIAGISLLVGGIGVMNIMLVTVTERTREIGIRKALGARRSNLLLQFLIESIVLTGVGGLLGVALGGGLAQIRIGSFGASFQPWMAGLAFGVSVFIGVVFGVYPANRAAKLRPIDALRYE
jgi:putative ABC transport system permease protein